MTIRNAGADSTTLQLRVLAWSQKDGEDVLELAQEVLANPGGFALAPGASQLARFGLRTGPARWGLALSAGDSSSFISRSMKGGGSVLSYNLYTTDART